MTPRHVHRHENTHAPCLDHEPDLAHDLDPGHLSDKGRGITPPRLNFEGMTQVEHVIGEMRLYIKVTTK